MTDLQCDAWATKSWAHQQLLKPLYSTLEYESNECCLTGWKRWINTTKSKYNRIDFVGKLRFFKHRIGKYNEKFIFSRSLFHYERYLRIIIISMRSMSMNEKFDFAVFLVSSCIKFINHTFWNLSLNAYEQELTL